ncbi:Delta(12) fatty acid desaturase [Lachnellula occidentalis]|uniref:Delta(12) fatty acid desaturase n=1 Tax=Lachnellula occidentalis TaxID=215460 RepID=A0A8H8RI60_9HELO|nr:Delta(12) fatty acid desaturase [Lachnellula occidentalis]
MADDDKMKHEGAEPSKHIDLYGNIVDLPDFTMKQIYDAIPAHCFQPSLLRSLAYVVRDYLYLGTLMYSTYIFVPILPSIHLRALCYSLYTVLAGMIMTGIWILAHECGHGAFSKSRTLNNTAGFFLHSSLLVPYHSWRITHSYHHKATGDLERDTVFVPHSREYWVKHNLGRDADPLTVEHLSEDAPIVTLYHCIVHQLFGWPLYLLDNLSSQKGERGFPYYSHYWFGSDSALFKASELSSVLLSDMGVLLMAGLLCMGVNAFGWWTMLVFYGVPYLWLNHWIGAAATIYRDFGFIDTHLFHNIVGTHVVHHLVSSIPFYHAQEATEAVKTVKGKHYHADRKTNLMAALWRNQRDCQFVEESPGMEGSGVFMFRNLHGRGVRPRNLSAGEALTAWVGSMPPKATEVEETLDFPIYI